MVRGKKRRKVSREHIPGFTTTILRQLARRGGVRRVKGVYYGDVRSTVQRTFQPGQVVWAKLHGSPHWPAIVFESWNDAVEWGITKDPKMVQRHRYLTFFLDVLNVSNVVDHHLTPFDQGCAKDYYRITTGKKSQRPRLRLAILKANILSDMKKHNLLHIRRLRNELLRCFSIEDVRNMKLPSPLNDRIKQLTQKKLKKRKFQSSWLVRRVGMKKGKKDP